jgi:hypothetical protein
MSEQDRQNQAATRLRLRLARILVVRRFARWSAPWWFLWGAMILAMRVLLTPSSTLFAVGLLAFPLLVLLAHCRERRRLPSQAQALALVDGTSQAGGLLMARGEGFATEGWEGAGRRQAFPEIRWEAGRLAALHGVGAIFLVLCLVLPAPRIGPPEKPHPLDLGALVAEYKAQIEELAEEEVLNEAEKEELLALAQRLAEERSGDDPELAWEALDSLRDALADKAREAADKALREMMTAEQARDLLDQLAKALQQGELTPDAAAQAAQAMADFMADQPGGEDLANLLRDAALEGLTPEEMQQLAQCAGEWAEKADGNCQNLALRKGAFGEAGEFGEKRAQCRAAAQQDLAEFLAKQGGNCEGAAMLAVCSTQCGWGVDRGPGPAPLTWQQGSREEGAQFKETILPGQRPEDLGQTRRVGIDATAPEVVDGPEATQAGQLSGAAAGGGSGRAQRILPRHRQAVSAYFTPAGAKQP